MDLSLIVRTIAVAAATLTLCLLAGCGGGGAAPVVPPLGPGSAPEGSPLEQLVDGQAQIIAQASGWRTTTHAVRNSAAALAASGQFESIVTWRGYTSLAGQALTGEHVIIDAATQDAIEAESTNLRLDSRGSDEAESAALSGSDLSLEGAVRTLESPGSAPARLTAVKAPWVKPGSRRVAFLLPYEKSNAAATIAVFQANGWGVDVWRGAEVTPSVFMKVLGDGYGAIVFAGHGSPDDEGRTTIALGDFYGDDPAFASLSVVQKSRLVRYYRAHGIRPRFQGHTGVTSEFVRALLLERGLPNTFVWMAACNSATRADMAAAFLDNGARAFVGYRDFTSGGVDGPLRKAVFEEMFSGDVSASDALILGRLQEGIKGRGFAHEWPADGRVSVEDATIWEKNSAHLTFSEKEAPLGDFEGRFFLGRGVPYSASLSEQERWSTTYAEVELARGDGRAVTGSAKFLNTKGETLGLSTFRSAKVYDSVVVFNLSDQQAGVDALYVGRCYGGSGRLSFDFVGGWIREASGKKTDVYWQLSGY